MKAKKKLPKKKPSPPAPVAEVASVPATPVPAKGDKFKIGVRWSDKLAKDGFVPVVNHFLDHYHALKPCDLTHSEAMFIIHLIRYKWNEMAPYPGYKTLAKQMGVSHKSARRYAQSLEAKGYLRRRVRIAETNRFDISPLIAALEKHLEQIPAAKKI